MAARKRLVKDRKELANMMCKLEAGRSQIKVGDAREALRLLVGLEATGYLASRTSIFVMLRKEAVELAKAKRAAGI